MARIEDEWLWGWDPTPGIVSVWAEPDEHATVWRRGAERELSREKVTFRPWVLLSGDGLLPPSLAAASTAVRSAGGPRSFIDPNVPLSVAAWAAVLSSATVDSPYRDFFKLTTDGAPGADSTAALAGK